jgi:hypothetical protein
MATESENNDTTDLADPIASGVKVSGALQSASDVDFYRLDVTAAGVLSLAFDAPAGLPTNAGDSDYQYYQYYGLSLYDSQNTLLGRYQTTIDKTYTFALPSAGSYFVSVDVPTWYHTDEIYGLTATHTPGSFAAVESESNDSQPDTLSSGSAIQGQLSSAEDVDRYRIQADAAGSLSIVLDVPTSSTDTDYFSLQVLDDQGTVLARYLTGQDRTVSVGLPQAGAYDVVIQADTSGYSTNHNGNAYKLTPTLTAGNEAAFESEANDSSPSADPLNLGAATTGQLASTDDVDFYQLTIDAKGVLALDVDAPTNSSTEYFELTVYSDDASTALYTYRTGKDQSYAIGLPKAGTYFLSVDNYSTSQDGAYLLNSSFTQGAASGKELENNDTTDLADPIASGVKVSGALQSASDVDFYRLDATAAGVLSLAFDAPAGLPTNAGDSDYQYYQYYGLSLYDSQNTLLGRYQTTIDKTYTFALPSAGSYFVSVDVPTWYHTDEIYGLTATHTPGSFAAVESESNDSQPDTLSSGSAIQGQLSSAEDVDRYRIQADAAGSLSIVLDVPTSSTDTDYFSLQVLDDQGTVLARYLTGQDRTVSVGLPQAGAYDVVIQADTSGYSTNHNGNAYKLTPTLTAGNEAAFESEGNETKETADTLTFDIAIKGQLSDRLDVDYFKVATTEAGVFTLNFDTPTNSAYSDYFTIRLINATGATLAEIETGRDQTLQAAVGRPGTYYIEIESGYWGHDDGAYSLTGSFATGSNGFELEPNEDFAKD